VKNYASNSQKYKCFIHKQFKFKKFTSSQNYSVSINQRVADAWTSNKHVERTVLIPVIGICLDVMLMAMMKLNPTKITINQMCNSNFLYTGSLKAFIRMVNYQKHELRAYMPTHKYHHMMEV
jgi:hypothetical protein